MNKSNYKIYLKKGVIDIETKIINHKKFMSQAISGQLPSCSPIPWRSWILFYLQQRAFTLQDLSNRSPFLFGVLFPLFLRRHLEAPPRRLLLLSILSVNQDIQDPTVVLSVTSPTRSLDVLVVLPSPLRNRPVFISVWPSIHGLKTPNIDKELLQ